MTCSPVTPKPAFPFIGSVFGLSLSLGFAIAGPTLAADAQKLIPVTVQRVAFGKQQSSVELTGVVAARNVSDVGFRINGRVLSREVEVGDHVVKGEILARLEADVQNADLASATAAINSAAATYKQREADYQRQVSLLEKGVGTQALVDNAEEQLQAASASQTTTKANFGIASDSLANTILRAPVDGVVNARKVEVGQVVEAAQAIYTLAEDGGRDAVFDIYEALLTKPLGDNKVNIALVSNPSVSAVGTVREVSPVIDASTGTIRVKIALPQPLPPAMGLGASVTGSAAFDSGKLVSVPWTALTREDGKPAVWIVDPANGHVEARPVDIATYRSNDVLIADGVKDGDLVVTTGIPFLKPGIAVEPRVTGEKG